MNDNFYFPEISQLIEHLSIDFKAEQNTNYDKYAKDFDFEGLDME